MATYYWVGGSGTWDTTSTINWALTSGGIGGAAVPGSGDDAVLDAASGTVVVTLGENVLCSKLTCTGFTGTLDFGVFSIGITGVGTAFAQSTTMTVIGTPVINLTDSGALARVVSVTNILESNAVSFNVTAGTGTFSHTNLAGIKNLDFTGFSGNWNNQSGTFFGDLIISTGMTLSSGAATRTFAITSGIQQIISNGKTFDFPVTIAATGATVQLQGALTSGATRTLTHTSGALDLAGYTFTIGRFASSNSNVRSINFGTGQITLTGENVTVASVSDSTNFTYTGTSRIECVYSGSTGTRTIIGASTGGTATNTLNYFISAGTDTLTINGARKYSSINFTGFAGTLSATATLRELYGDLVISSGMTLSAEAGGFSFTNTSGVQQITTAGKTLDFPLNFDGVGGEFAFQDALTQGATNAFTIANGTVKLKDGVTTTVGAFTTTGVTQKSLQSTLAGTQATLSQASGTVSTSYLTIQDINATGGATWQAYTTNQNIDAGNNTGWDFIQQVGRYIYTRRKNKRILP